MGMKPPANEPQSQLAANLVSGPKDVGEISPQSNLVSSPKAVEESVKGMPGNVLVGGGPGDTAPGGGGSKNPG